MACERYGEELTAHAAGADATPRLRAHMDGCAACRDRLARERRLLAALDHDLTASLRVEPSVEFQARVRQRVAEGDNTYVGSGFSRISRNGQFALAAASLVLVAGLTIAVLLRTGVAPTERATRVSIAAAQTPDMPTVPLKAPGVSQPPAPVAPNDVRSQVVARHHTPTGGLRAMGYGLRATDYGLRTRPQAAEPEVLVPPDQRLAIARLLEMIRTRKIDERMLPATSEAELAAPAAQVVAPIVVEELKVLPIDVVPVGGTEKHEVRRP